MGKNQHVAKAGKKWSVKGEGNKKNTALFDTQKEANLRAIEIAKNQKSEVLIHGKDGKIREKNSYGNDPNKIKG